MNKESKIGVEAMKKDVLSITDLSREEIYELLKSATDLKEKRKAGEPTEFLKNKSLGMIFEKSSTILLIIVFVVSSVSEILAGVP